MITKKFLRMKYNQNNNIFIIITQYYFKNNFHINSMPNISHGNFFLTEITINWYFNQILMKSRLSKRYLMTFHTQIVIRFKGRPKWARIPIVGLSQTYLSRGSIQVVFLLMWSIKYILPSKSRPTSHPSGRGISPLRLFGIFFTIILKLT